MSIFVRHMHADTPTAFPNADSVVAGIIFTCCAVVVILTLFTVTGYHFVIKHSDFNNGESLESARSVTSYRGISN